MTSLAINKIKKLIFSQATPVVPGVINNNQTINFVGTKGGPESSKIYGCSTCIVKSKKVPNTPATLSNSKTPIISVQSTPDSLTTQRRNDFVLSATSDILSATLATTVVPIQRFSYVLPPIIPPPDIIAVLPYRKTNEPVARIPVCVGPKRINT